jgi:sialic acid synthase SpsE
MTATIGARPAVLIAAESWATSLASVQEDAAAAAAAGADAVVLAATRSVAPATLPFELADFEVADEAPAPALSDLAGAVRAVRAAGLSVTLAVVDLDLLADAGAVDGLYVPAAALTDLPFLARVADAGPALWLGTAMSTQAEVEEAVALLVKARVRVTLVHGLETTPGRADELNLRAITTLRDGLTLPVGFRAGDAPAAACTAAVACGATVLIVPARRAGEDLAAIVTDVRRVVDALGDGVKRPQASEWTLRDRRQHSLVARVAIPRGAVLTAAMFTTAPPGLGLKPRSLGALVGRRTAVDIPGGTLVTLGMVE